MTQHGALTGLPELPGKAASQGWQLVTRITIEHVMLNDKKREGFHLLFCRIKCDLQNIPHEQCC